MNTVDDLERGLRSWMADEAPSQAPGPLYEAIIGGSRAVPQRHRRWSRFLRARPWDQDRSSGAYAARRIATILVMAALLILAVAAAVLVGSRLLPTIPREPLPIGVFEPTGQIPGASDLQRPALASLADGRVMVAGGNTDYTMTAVFYDPGSGTYGEPIPMGAPRWDATATTLPDGRVLVVGGISPDTDLAQASAELFDPDMDTFTTAASMAAARRSHTATLLDDGRVLIAGGSLNRESAPGSQSFVAQPIASVELYEPKTGTFRTTGPMTTERVGHTATPLADGTVLIVGGYRVADDGTYAATASAEVFDPATETFRPVGGMGTARAGHTATRLPDGRVLVAGGGTAFDPDGYASRVSSTAEIYDPRTDSFAPTGSLRTERTRHSATLLQDGRVLVAGGSNPLGSPLTTELFDPATGAFEPGGTATSEHRFAIAPLLPDGRVLFPESWGTEIYDPKGQPSSGATVLASPATRPAGSGAFHPVATTIRERHTATLLEDGRVLIAGGFGGPDQTDLASAEIFDPRSDSFTLTGSMAVARQGAVTTRLPDRRVLMVGGDPTRSAEVYDPSIGMFGAAAPEVTSWLDDDTRAIPVPGLAAGTLALLRHVAGEGTEPSEVLTLIDGTDGHEIVSASLCGSYPSFGSPAAGLRDGRILVLCGPDEPARLIDAATRAIASAGIQGDWVAAVPLADGRVVLVSAQWNGDDPTAAFVISAVYDPVAGRVDELGPSRSTSMNGRAWMGRYVPMAEMTDGTVLVAGGSGGLSGSSDAAWLLDLDTGATRDVGPMLATRGGPSVTALEDGRALIVGGVTQPPDRTDAVPAAAELLDARGSR